MRIAKLVISQRDLPVFSLGMNISIADKVQQKGRRSKLPRTLIVVSHDETFLQQIKLERMIEPGKK